MTNIQAGSQGGVAVIVATCGRAPLVNILLQNLERQTRRPDAVYVVGASEDDIAGLDHGQQGLTTVVGRRGSSSQRNDGLRLAGDRFSTIVFFDDDFIPSRYWIETVANLYEENPDVVSITGSLLADGATGSRISLEDGTDLVARKDREGPKRGLLNDGFGPYGCNMSFRFSAIADVSFDERLPLYAWLEDCDMGGQIKGRGRQVRADALWGVHLAHRTARTSGVPLGYSQISNVVYIARKGGISPLFLAKIAAGNFLKNLLRAARPEPLIDRRGRLRGNLLAILDILRGRVTPERAGKL